MECTKSGAATIFISRVNKRYGRKIVLQDFSLNVSDCMIMGLLGESGAGKSTILSMAAGFARPDSGEITVLGERPRSARLVGHIGAYLNGSRFAPEQKVGQYFAYLADLQRLPAAPKAVDSVLDSVGGLPWKPLRFGDISDEMLRQLGVAQAFLGSPPIIILDDPMLGQSEKTIHSIQRLIRAHRGAMTAIITSRHIGMLEPFCDELSVIGRGRIESSNALSTLRTSSIECQIEVEAIVIPETAMAEIVGVSSVTFDADTRTLTVGADPKQISFEKLVEELARVLGNNSIPIRSIKRNTPITIN